MDRDQRTSRIDGKPASGQSEQFGCADEFADVLSIEDLAMRWRCSPKTARARVVANGLGINPAGTWLISRKRVREFEETLRARTIADPTTPAAAKPDEARNRVREGLAKLRILRSRRVVPDMGEGAGGSSFRKAG